jgi:hypothetical protein
VRAEWAECRKRDSAETAGSVEDVATGLVAPTVITFGRDGIHYVSNFGAAPPGAGQIVRIDIPQTAMRSSIRNCFPFKAPTRHRFANPEKAAPLFPQSQAFSDQS